MGSYLHPDHAYTGGSRRGSSQSEQLEVETYQLSQDFSRSLPGSRRSSFQKEGEKQGIVVESYLEEYNYSTLLRTRYNCIAILWRSAKTKIFLNMLSTLICLLFIQSIILIIEHNFIEHDS